MLRVTATQTVAASPEQVWELLSDTSRYAEYVEGTAAVLRNSGQAREGATYEELNPILGPWKARTTWTVVEFDPPRRQRHRSLDVPLTSTLDVVMEVEPDDDGSRVTLTLEGAPSHGPLGAAFARLMRGQVDRDNRKTIENFAALAARTRSGARATA